jgi:hypothetical protein
MVKNTENDTIKYTKPPLEPIEDDSSSGDYDSQKSFCGSAYASSMVDNSSRPTTILSVSNDVNLDAQIFFGDDIVCEQRRQSGRPNLLWGRYRQL